MNLSFSKAMMEKTVILNMNIYESLLDELNILRQQVGQLQQTVLEPKPGAFCLQPSSEMSWVSHERQFLEIAANLPGAIFQFTIQEGIWKIDYISSRISDLTGVTAPEMIRDVNRFMERIHPHDFHRYVQSVMGALNEKNPWLYEGRFVKLNGEIRWWQGRSTPTLNEQGEAVFCGILLDITDRKQAEASVQHLQEQLEVKVAERTAQLYQKTVELQQSETRFRCLLEATSQIIWNTGPDGQVHREQSSWCEFTGQTHEETLAWGWLAAIHPEDREYTAKAWTEALASQTLYKIEHRLRRHDGEYRYMIVKAIPLVNSDGRIREWVGTHTDITERKQTEIQLRQQTQDLERALKQLQITQAQLVQNEKMSSLGQLVAGVAHEINNPVNFIHGNLMHAANYGEHLLQVIQAYQHQYPHPPVELEELIETVELDYLIEDFPKVIHSMQMGAQRIRAIITSLRNFSRLDEAEVKAVDLHEGIDSTLMILQSRIKAKSDRPEIQVIKHYGQLPPIQCYVGQLNQVFMNILVNAIDALEEQNRQRTLAEILQNPGTICITTEWVPSASQVKITLSDNGPGIPQATQSRIFDPFFTTKAIGKGTGLGMSISYQIVTEKHQGSLECISSEGKGATFIITIPVYQGVS